MRGDQVIEELGDVLCSLEHAIGEFNGGQDCAGREGSRALLYTAQNSSVSLVLVDWIPNEIGEALEELYERVEYTPALDQILHLISLYVAQPLAHQTLKELLDAQKSASVVHSLQLDLGVAQLHHDHE